jgi:hypothetical protein
MTLIGIFPSEKGFLGLGRFGRMARGQKKCEQERTREKTEEPIKVYFIHIQSVINIFVVIFQVAKVTYLWES